MATKELIERIKSTEDYFEILGVERDAGNFSQTMYVPKFIFIWTEASEIIKAYRKLALKLHPDKCKEAEGEEAFKKVTELYAASVVCIPAHTRARAHTHFPCVSACLRSLDIG
jgi:preprotein translocase subunit Sec63